MFSLDVATATVFLAVPVWLYVAASDIRHRHAPNAAWLALGALGVVGLAAECTACVAGSLTVSVVTLYPAVTWLWATDRMGGADAKAFYVAPLLYPGSIFAFLAVAAVAAVPWHFVENERGTPLLVPLACAAFAVTLAGYVV